MEDNFSNWYTETITKAEMIEYYDVSGCYIIRPWGFFVWKQIQKFLGGRLELMGIEDCYFPMFVSKSCLEREKEHVEGFAPEVAWVTKAGETDLEMPVAIRPTSETVMYPYYSKWIRSHRDLPVRLNMWNNVIRWEFSHPTPFIRTREFLWQEGHCAWATEEGCSREVLQILDNYAAVYEELLAVPVVKGKKTEKEKFAGAYYTTTVETYVPAVGRGCQGATSHNLGQNFGKMFDINFQDPEHNERSLVPWQNSWGLSTRVIGVMIMVHGDNRGLVMPPRVSSVQVVIIPVGITKDTTEAEKQALVAACQRLEEELRVGGVRARCDLRDNYSPGWRFNHWEVKGVPVRVELGPKELQSQQLALSVRYNGEKRAMAWDGEVAHAMHEFLESIHHSMLEGARQLRLQRTRRVTEWADFVPALNTKNIILAPWCGAMDCEDNIKKVSADESKAAQEDVREDERAPSMGAKSLCIPFEQPESVEGRTCICKGCTAPAKHWVLWGRSY
ncbi:prolyl-tRNA synthetase [Strigomonas culicis]|uniref:proline--tRNA ligase n=1 Tax=Strigomonas culicis TaxID=28005 RepID=S9VJN2_9TRYP|nr:prolyl-tRNA synthetase [Strigomonas culicis]|eukprot:EPY27266.1 prolyl-tRNA synthetase [Strigomonas culicis]